MTSVTTEDFRKAFAALPEDVRRQAIDAYRLWLADSRHPSLRFRRVHPTQPIFSARIGLHYRAISLVENDTATWFWIGSHADYDRFLRTL